MKDGELKKDDSEIPAVQLLQQINAGLVDPRLLDPTSRQRCIELLVAEGYTVPNIAQVLKRSEKTVSRDLKEIQARHALSPDVEFAKQFIGQVFQKAMNHHDHLVRLARTQGATVGEKVLAEASAWKVLKELVERLQDLGYLPSKPEQVSGDIYHHIVNEDGGESYDQVKKMIADIESAAKETNSLTPELTEELAQLKARLEKAEIFLQAKQISKQQQNVQIKEA
jgi:phage protein D